MISVCVATYNGEKYIRRQLESILQELPEDAEVIVSDDGSVDSTVEIVRSIKDARIVVLNNTERHGVNGNFNNALNHVKGEIIFLSDQDDEWCEGKVKNCMKALETSLCVTHDALITDEMLNPSGQRLSEIIGARRGFWSNFLRNGYTGCCMAFRRELLKDVLPLPKTSVFLHDQWIGLMADLAHGNRYIDFNGIWFRRHENTCSSVGASSRRSAWIRLLGRFSLAYQLMKRKMLRL